MTGTTTSETEASTPEETPAAPFLRVITPGTTPEEVAAIVAVLASLGSGEAAPAPAPSLWASPARQARQTPGRALAHGRGAWRASGLPR